MSSSKITEKIAANRLLWIDICKSEGWCPSCSLEIPYDPVVLDKYGNCDIYTCSQPSILYTYDGELLFPDCQVQEDNTLTESTSITGLSITEVLEIKILAQRQGLIGLATRADAAIQLSDHCPLCSMLKGWGKSCTRCPPSRVCEKNETAPATASKSPPLHNEYY